VSVFVLSSITIVICVLPKGGVGQRKKKEKEGRRERVGGVKNEEREYTS
jgi:hypothetical protein